MIKANELRIGSIIKLPHLEEFVKVSEVYMNGEYDCYYVKYEVMYIGGGGLSGCDKLSDFVPYPMSPEILENCGFKFEDDDISPYHKLVIARTEAISIEDDFSFGLNAENESSKEGYASGPGLCKYVHQLQNLYFALTGEELTIRL